MGTTAGHWPNAPSTQRAKTVEVCDRTAHGREHGLSQHFLSEALQRKACNRTLEATMSLSPFAASEFREAPTQAEGSQSHKFCCPFDATCDVEFDTQNVSNPQLRNHCHLYHDLSTSTCHWRHPNGLSTCSERLKDLNGLLRHVSQVHLHSNAVICSRCGDTLSRRDSLLRHSRRCRDKG